MNKLKSFLFAVTAIIGISVNGASAQNFSDRAIQEKIAKKVRYLSNTNVFDYVTVQVNGGTVTLGGKVITLGTKDEAARVAKEVDGVVSVVNNIDMLPPSSFDDRIRRAALATFTSRGPAQYFGHPNPDVKIIVESGRITLEGYVARKSDSDTLSVLAHGITGTFGITNNLVVGKRIY